MFAKVAVSIPSQNTDNVFTYAVPEEFRSCIYIGSRVYVEFGFQKVLGYVLELTDTNDFLGNVKEILDVIDFEQGLNPEQIALAREISENTKSYLISALELMIPSPLKSRIKKYINVLNFSGIDAGLAMLFGLKKKFAVTKEILAQYPKIRREIEKGNLEIVTDVSVYGKRKAVKYYRLGKDSSDHVSAKQSAVLHFLREKGEAMAEEIRSEIGCSDSVIERLVDEGYLITSFKAPKYETEEERFVKPVTFDFNGQQLKEKYLRLSGKPFLLISDDENFKLDFYLDIANRCVSEKKQVLICTPTLLTNSRILHYFQNNMKGYRIFGFSSNLTDSEYFHNYQNVKNQNCDIAIVTKSSIFLPLERIGLIIMIDEDNPNYINEQNPKYSTLEVLKSRCSFHQAKLVLASAVPSISSYYQYFTAKYFLLERILNLPKTVQLVSMREETGDLMLSRMMKDVLKRTLENKKVSLLLLNNLSYNTALLCGDCGSPITCPNCKVNLQYHKEKDLYRCPYCNTSFTAVICDKCGSHHLEKFGFGLEKLKESLQSLFPAARIVQVDSESMDFSSYRKFFSMLDNREIDIIIGTNIIEDLVHPDIAAIGILSADSILHYADYRAAEICFRLISKLTQFPHTETVIQGYDLDHYAISAAVSGKFADLYNQEIEVRSRYHYPPFSEMNRLLISGEYKSMYYYANYFKKVFTRIEGGECLGPTYQARSKSVQLLLKHQNFEKIRTLIDEVNKKFKDADVTVSFERYPKL